MNTKSFYLLLFGLFCSFGIYAQQYTISGTVTDSDGMALPGAAVFAANQAIGTSANEDGEYQITVNAGKVILEVTYVGFSKSSREILVNQDMQGVDFTLSPGVALDEVVVYSGSKKAEKLTNSPSTIVSISPREIEEFPGNPAELIARKKGVDYFRAGIATPAFNIRGFNSNFNSKNLQVIDNRISSLVATGLPLGPLSTVIKEDTEQAEVILGPNATLYGPNAHNGLINIRTKDPRTYQGGTVVGNLGVNGDGNAFNSLRLRWADKVSEKFAYKVTGEYTRAEEFEYADSVYIDRKDALGNIYAPGTPNSEKDGIKEGYEEFQLDPDVEFIKAGATAIYTPSPGTDIIATYEHSNSTYLSPTNVGRNQIVDWKINVFQLRFNTKNFFAQVYRTSSKTDDTYSIDDRTKAYYANLDAGVPEDVAGGEASFATGARFRDDSHRWNAEAQYTNTLFNDKLEVVTGIQWQLDRANSLGSYLLDENEEDYIEVGQIGGYAHMLWDMGLGFKALGAARIDNHEIYGTNFIPKAGIIKEFGKGTLRLTYGQGIAAPTIFNMYANLFGGLILGNAEGFSGVNPFTNEAFVVAAQEVEKLNTYEIGYRGTIGSKLYIDVNAYFNNNKNFLSPVTAFLGVTQRGDTPIEEVQAIPYGLVATYINFGEVNTYGTDLSLTYMISPSLNVTANYSYFDYSYDENNLENDFNNDGVVNYQDVLVNAPNNKGSLAVNYSGDKFYGSVFSRWVEEYNYFSSFQIASETIPGETYRGTPIVENAPGTDSFNYGPLGGFVTLDLNAGYRISEKFSVGVAITNLFNQDLREFTAAPPTRGLYLLETKFNF
ncbi:TonB-dependent receptor [Robertkochia marina]|uniref:TonB-dependent receptor n=1 Tax=Robertkochia marina TaxID=1227945 RepID=A0A4S3M227_9FLAO|nr:TonB-dependent receptor [Robertkochia marina]THD68083.1 TonB-dependent receptor [Robertkochia marina]TRZ42631.1 TonB-dependent receptor [Robertkochia marina]